MQKYLKMILRPIYHSSPVRWILSFLGVIKTPFKRLNSSFSVSDLFPFFLDNGLETRFDIQNIASLLRPDLDVSETVEILFFNEAGTQIRKKTIYLAPKEMVTLYLKDEVPEGVLYGSFAVIHSPSISDLMLPHKTSICERGYLGIKRKTDLLWSYVHGNSYVLAGRLEKSGQLNYLNYRTHSRHWYMYRPQVSLNDCKDAELCFVCQSDRTQKLSLTFYDEANAVISRLNYTLSAYQTLRVALPHPLPYRVESESNLYMFRPIIIKYYESHFDLLHS